MHSGRSLQMLTYALLIALSITGCGKSKAAPKQPPPVVAQPSPQAPPPTPAQIVGQADALRLKGDAAGAAELLIHLVGERPDDASAWNLLSLAYAQLGEAAAAHLVGERAAALAPTDWAARYNAGVASAKANQRERAVVLLEQSAALNPGQAEPIMMLARLYEFAFQPAEARAAFHDAATRFPNQAELKRAKAAFETDLSMDGWPDRIRVTPAMVTVDNSSTGTTMEIPGEWKSARVVDLGGQAPALMTVNPETVAVHAIVGRALVEVGRFASKAAVFSPIDQAMVVTTETEKLRTAAHHQMEGGALVVKRQLTFPTNPFLPPTGLVDLFAKVVTLNPGAFAGTSVSDDVRTHLGQEKLGPVRAPFLRAMADGTYELEIFQDGKITERAKAEMKQFEIAALQWQK